MKDDWWQMHHGARWFTHYLCCEVASSSLLIVVASDNLDHIIAFINFKIFLNFILSNSILICLLARADQKQKQKWHFWSGFSLSKMDLHFWVLELFKNGSPFFSLFLVPYEEPEPRTKTKTPFLFLFLTPLLERPQWSQTLHKCWTNRSIDDETVSTKSPWV